MVTIKVLDVVDQASTYEDGELLFMKIVDFLEKGDEVIVSFDGINAVPSAFVNSAFIRLLEKFDFDFIKNNLSFIESTKFINELIRSRFIFSNR